MNPELRYRRDFGGEEVGEVKEDVLAASVCQGLDADRVGSGAAGGEGEAGEAHEGGRDLGHLGLDHFGESFGAASVIVVGEGECA